MIISYDRPIDIDFIVSGAIAISADLTVMANGRANERARFTWPLGAQTTSTSVRLFATWGAAARIAAAAIVGCTLPAGTRVDVSYAGSGSPTDVLIGTYRLRSHPLGWRSLFVDLLTSPEALLEDTAQIVFEFFNDVDGVATIAAGSTFEIGEVWCGKGIDIPIKPALSISYEDRSVAEVSVYSQPWLLPEVPRRRFAASAALLEEDRVFGRVADLEQVHARLLSQNPAVIIPTSVTRDGTFSQDIIDATGMLGFFQQVPAINHIERRFYETGEYVFMETPVKQ